MGIWVNWFDGFIIFRNGNESVLVMVYMDVIVIVIVK